MHIPSGDTQDLPLLSFARALAENRKEGYDPARWLYVPDFYTEYRYVLGRPGQKTLICAGLNPSTAVPDNLDNTLKSVERIANANGYDGWMMFNVYAQRATRPDDMDRACNWALHRENLLAFQYLLELAGEKPVVWAAWGAVVEKRGYLLSCVADLEELARVANARWVCAGPVSKKGHPHHPLYLKKDATLTPFAMEDYLKSLREGNE